MRRTPGPAQDSFILMVFRSAILVGVQVSPVRTCENEERTGGIFGQNWTTITIPRHTPNWRKCSPMGVIMTAPTISAISAVGGNVKQPVGKRYWALACFKARSAMWPDMALAIILSSSCRGYLSFGLPAPHCFGSQFQQQESRVFRGAFVPV